MRQITLFLFLLASNLSAQVMDTVPSPASAPVVQFGYMIRGRIVDGFNRKEVLHFIELGNDKYWLWETDKYYIKINMPKVFEKLSNYNQSPYSDLAILATLESGKRKLNIPISLEGEIKGTDPIGKKQYLYLFINGSDLKSQFKNIISENKNWDLKITITMKKQEIQSYIKKVEADWAIRN